ncbi:MAG: hypothetical protein ACW99J_20310 [Candidatus Thorarchaeota archaeon]|jgi:hypothetical protein
MNFKNLIILGAIVIAAIVIAIVGYALDWFGTVAEEVLDPHEALSRWRWFYDTHQALQAQQNNVMRADNSVSEFIDLYGNNPTDWGWQAQEEYQRRTTIRDGYIINYNRVAQEYNAKMRDITRNFAAPSDLPTHIPNWE